jgi:hypothetical protein
MKQVGLADPIGDKRHIQIGEMLPGVAQLSLVFKTIIIIGFYFGQYYKIYCGCFDKQQKIRIKLSLFAMFTGISRN